MFLRFELKEIDTTLLLESWINGFRCISLERQRVGYQDAHVPLPLSHLPEDFVAAIPEDLASAAVPFGECALRLLSLARQEPACAELLLCRPVLLLLAVLHWPHDNRPILMNSRRGQRALLQAMGLPPRRSLLGFLDRLRLDLSSEWQREYLSRLLYDDPATYQQLSHVSEVHPAQLFLLFHAPELGACPLIHALRYDYADLFWFTRTLDVLNQALALARAGRFPGGLSALRAMGSLAQLGAVIRQVEEACDRKRQFEHLCGRLGFLGEGPLPLASLTLSHLQTPWLQLVLDWPSLDQACAALDPRQCEVWSPTLLNDVMRGRQAIFRVCSPGRHSTVGWVRLGLSGTPADPASGSSAMTALLATTGARGSWLPRFWLRQLHRHLSAMPLVLDEASQNC
jgi:hypothetical protein